MNSLFQVYHDGTIEGRIYPRSYSSLTAPQQRKTLQAPQALEKGSEYLKMQYRALSQALVWQEGWFGMVVTDFSQDDVLKSSVPLLEGITVMPDHKFSAGDYLGIVESTLWTESVNDVPVPGVDAIYKLDIDPNPSHPSRRIIRGVEQGYIRGSSVRVWFDYEKSHPELDAWDFYELMGHEVDGEVVRFIATHIRRYLETSIVIAGADPLAAPVDDVEDGQRAELAASFSRSGWTVPTRPAHVALSTNPIHKEIPMRRKKKNLDVQEDTDDQLDQAVVAQDAPTEEGDQEPAEELVEEDVLEVVQDSPEPEDVSDDADHADAEDVSVDDQDDDAPDEEDETVALTHEELGALFDARLKEREAVFDAERQALLAERDAALREKATAEHRFALETFYADLKVAYPDLPASFDELSIVDGLMVLSQEPAIPMGDEIISPFAWGKLLLTEVAKYAQVPTERLASHAKAPGDVAKDRQAEIQAAIKHKLEANPKLSERLAMKELAGERPDLFPTQ